MTGNHWQDKGVNYDRYRPTYPGALADHLARLAPHRRLALDVGCGTGQFTQLLADHFDEVIASDVSPDQLANAPVRSNVTYVEGAAESLEAPTDAAGLIVAAQAAHWFDLPRFHDEVRRIASEGAILALVTYGVPVFDGGVKEKLEQFYWGDFHAFWPKGRQHVENGYRDLAFPFPTLSLPDFVIERRWSVEHLFNYVETWSATKCARAAGAGHFVDDVRNDVYELMGGEALLEVRWPISIRAGIINRC